MQFFLVSFVQLEDGIPCSETCGDPSRKANHYCDDVNNNCGCDWDGGDCCGSNVNTQYCSACQCLDPREGGTGGTGGTQVPPSFGDFIA